MKNRPEIKFSSPPDKMTIKSQVRIRRQSSNMFAKKTFCDSVHSVLYHGMISLLLITSLTANSSYAEEWLRNTYNTRYVF